MHHLYSSSFVDFLISFQLNVKNTGPHKRKITISVSLQGIKIKDEKTGVSIRIAYSLLTNKVIQNDFSDHKRL